MESSIQANWTLFVLKGVSNLFSIFFYTNSCLYNSVNPDHNLLWASDYGLYGLFAKVSFYAWGKISHFLGPGKMLDIKQEHHYLPIITGK